MKLAAFSISFLLAFLLFAVQPMASKLVLPMFGGSPAVWNTAMLTFQLLLLAGYGYAHGLSTLSLPRQWAIHGVVVLVSYLMLPLAITITDIEAAARAPIGVLMDAFVRQIGLPFFVLSATAPLLQLWVVRSGHPMAQQPYVLYSASNLGSMAGLLGYVFVVEPGSSLGVQRMVWSGLYVLGTVMLLSLGRRLAKRALAAPAAPAEPDEAMPAAPIRWRQRLQWMWLAFLPSALSLGVTSYIATDIASVPLLWVVPLALYLLSFVDAFRTRPWLVPLCIPAAPVLGLLALLVYGMQGHQYSLTFLLQLVVFASLAFALHGWLARRKPPASQLTQFYLVMSVGGALGGVLNALVAPLVFNEAYEYPISLLLASLSAFCLWRGKAALADAARVVPRMVLIGVALYAVMYAVQGGAWLESGRVVLACAFAGAVVTALHRRYAALYAAVAVMALALTLVMALGVDDKQLLFRARSFFGVWRVFERPHDHVRYMMHNTTVHSVQRAEGEGALEVTSYYRALASSFELLPVLREHPLALVGLGAGTVKCFLQPAQQLDMFEIDPLVVRIANDAALFRYLRDCPGTGTVFVGDGRLRLNEQSDGRYGAIVLDAFSSDSIPTHLMTVEALRMYLQKLAPHGVLLMHTTNRHLDLWPLIAAQAQALGTVAYGKFFEAPHDRPLQYDSFWVVMARDVADIRPLLAVDGGWQALQPDARARPWRDDYSNLLPYLKLLRGE